MFLGDAGVSIIATALKHMIAAGMSGNDLVRAVAEMEAALPAPVDQVAEKRRAYDRQRKREKKRSGGIPVVPVETAEFEEFEELPPQVSPNDINSNPHPNTTSPVALQPSRSRPPKAGPFPKPDWADEQVWEDFLSNRKRKRLPNTATAYGKFLAGIERFTDAVWPPGRLLTVATGKGWGALYPSIKTLDDETGNGQRTNYDRQQRSRDQYRDPLLERYARGDHSGLG